MAYRITRYIVALHVFRNACFTTRCLKCFKLSWNTGRTFQSLMLHGLRNYSDLPDGNGSWRKIKPWKGNDEAGGGG